MKVWKSKKRWKSFTPYGINTHRLLVRGIRVLDEEQPLDNNLDSNIEQANNSNVNDNDTEFFESRNAKYNKAILIIKITVIVVFLLLVLGLVSSILPKKKARISKKLIIKIYINITIIIPIYSF